MNRSDGGIPTIAQIRLTAAMKKHWIIFMLSLVVSVQACNFVEKKPTIRIAFSQCVGSDAWRQTMLEEMRRELSFHPDVEFIYRDADNSNERQIEQLHELRSMRPDLIIVSPNEAEPLTPVVDQIFQHGIPVIVTDRKTSSGLYHAYVGADNYEIGYMAGQYLARRLGYVGTISEITGLPGSSATIERQRGFHEALKSYAGIRLKTQINGQWLIDVAKRRAAQQMADLSQSDAIFAYNDQMGFGTYQALRKAALKHPIKIVGVDALPGDNNGLQFVSEKVLDASMLYPTGGKECIQTAMAILTGQPYQRENTLSTLVVDSSNVQLMKLQTDKIISQQADIDKQQGLFAEQQQIFSNQQRVLNILVVSLVLAVVFAGIAFYSLKANWEKNKQLEHQNHEILDQQQRILEMTNEVEQATEAKINFFTNISHEFKTPLSLILVPLEELQKNSRLGEEPHRLLALIKRNALILQHLVSQLIDLRRVGYEGLHIKAKRQNMLLFCHNVVQCFRPLAQQRAVNLRLENQVADTTLWFDEDMIEKLLYNLLSNAFKFTPSQGEVVLRIGRPSVAENMLEIQVADTGEGIAERDIVHLFEPFYQGENHAKGSGIGLALCKEIAALHHGTITVHSKQGAGTTVTVCLPKGDGHLNAEERATLPPTETMNNVREAEPLLATLDPEIALVKEHGLYGATDFDTVKPHSVLIVEDHAEMRKFLAEKLAEQFTVFTASNAKEGLDQAYAQVPDLIISDVLMPGELGTVFAKKLKADVRTATIPIVLLTARGSEEQVLTGLDTLADAYLTKPFNMDYLLGTVSNLINNRMLLHHHFSSDAVELRPNAKAAPADRRFLNELAALVEENISNSKLNVDFIAERLAISRIQLYRKVKSLLACSINDYVSIRRLRKAKLLLQQGIPINHVAYQSGFSSPAYFSTAFKGKYGISPSVFKKNLLEATP
ncbi:sensor histidine kinase [Parapedobacter pyrenivorans]|uniref:histidine kinase n=1 Tax=Parapedobacter pyrenivorans TaxID=1305674 RepID=A0A917MDK8_9SPHI|nr:substrate-binding domain-containing protein [Parapedobacter pyrenivorans]GGG99194.1 sensor histidine kinase [Parapedobacter pyrenivorans]